MKLYAWLTFFISMLPLVELRGAIPYAQIHAVPLSYAYPLAVLGNILPIPVIYYFAHRFLRWGARQAHIGGFCRYVLSKGETAGQRLTARAGKTGVFLALMLFVGIPLPGTGAWTGTLAATLLDLDSKTTFLATACGVLLAGLLMLALSFGAAQLLHALH